MATYNGHNEDSSGNILLSIGNGMTATVETGTTASQAYTKGSYLFFNNRLCKATSAISSGATLAIGTNLSQTSIGQEITSHLRSSDGKEFYFDVKDGTYGYYPSAEKTASEFVPFGGTGTKFITISQEDAGYFSAISNIGNTPLAVHRSAEVSGSYEGYSWNRYSSGVRSFSLTVPSDGTYYAEGTGQLITGHATANQTLTNLGFVVSFFPD